MSTLSIGFLVVLAAVAGAQQAPLFTVQGQEGDVAFGTRLANVGDVDGDGLDDLLVGSPFSLSLRGTARVVSGADGAILFSYANAAPSGKPLDHFGFAVTGCGDLDGDGLAEFAISQTNVGLVPVGGRVRVYRGSDGTVLHELTAPATQQDVGSALANAGDVDGDGIDDLAIGAGFSDEVLPHAGAVFLMSGATGLLLHTWGGPATGSTPRFGDAVAGAGDANLDGLPDLAVGAPHYVLNGAYGLVDVFSGGTDVVLQHFTGEPSAFFGSTLAGGIDVNFSGTPDLLVGSPGMLGPFPQAASSAALLDVGTGALLFTVLEEGTSETGASLALGDVDGDGQFDLLVGEPQWSAPGHFGTGRVRIFDSYAYDLVAEVRGAANAAHAGRSVAALGDVNGDGLTDWAMGQPDVSPGSVLVFAGSLAWLDAGFALAGAGGPPHATGTGALVAGTPLSVALSGGPPSTAAVIVLGGASLLAPFKGGVLVPTLDVLLAGLPLDGDGALVLNGSCPPGIPSGLSLWAQFWMPDAAGPAGFAASNGLTTMAP
jgi:FG-GAP repeat